MTDDEIKKRHNKIIRYYDDFLNKTIGGAVTLFTNGMFGLGTLKEKEKDEHLNSVNLFLLRLVSSKEDIQDIECSDFYLDEKDIGMFEKCFELFEPSKKGWELFKWNGKNS